MKTKLLLLLSLIMSANFLTSCKAQTAPSANEREAVADNTGFAINLYHELPSREGNLFFSPYSISTALAMTYGGARGQTAKQMAQALQFTLPDHELHPAFAALHKELNSIQSKGQVQLSVANSLWPQSGFEFRRDYLDLCRDDYGTDIFPVDFVGHAEDSRQAINRWVEDNTSHKITNLLGPGSVDGARLVLVNAIYFKGKWAKEFDADNTRDEPFYSSPDTPINTPLMQQTDRFGYAEFDGLQVLELPYAGDDLSMLVLLPCGTNSAGPLAPRATNYDLGQLEAKLTPPNLALWTAKLPIQKVQVFLPKFKATSEFSLGATLGAMGMTDAFDPNKVDFSGMDGRPDLYISAVVHKAYVDVNEEGTEAAAATGVIMTLSAELPSPVPLFRADHPFLFLIRDNRTGSILFLGRITNPAQ
jgi:serpin B